ncbi:MAG: DUF3592 domain-containing protein [Paludibacteraceae bacterium]|nr:DUF3592 domain-containing protein [Paludibacteraceae bacterium]
MAYDRMDPQENPNRTGGYIFLLLGLVAFACFTYTFFDNKDNEDFFYLTNTVNGVSSYEYCPKTVIGMFIGGLLVSLLFAWLGIKLIRGDIPTRKELFPEKKKESSGFDWTGFIFLMIGVVSFAIPTYFLFEKGGDDDFYYVTTTVNGIQTVDYNPGFVIAMFIFCYLFAIAFLILGIYMMRKKGSWATSSTTVVLIDTSPSGRSHRPTTEEKRQASFLPKLSIIIGSVLILIGGSLLYWDRTSIKTYIKTEAKVLGVVRKQVHSGSKSSNSYYAKLEYEVEGKRYQSQISVSSFFNDEQITVYCNPSNPIRCRTNTEYVLWYIVLFLCGGMFLFGGIFLKYRIGKGDFHVVTRRD